MRPGAGLFQIVLRPPRDDDLPMLDVQLQHPFQREHARLAFDQREHIDGKARLQRRVFQQLIDDRLGVGAALQFDDDAHALAVGLVAQVANVFNAAVAHQVGDALNVS